MGRPELRGGCALEALLTGILGRALPFQRVIEYHAANRVDDGELVGEVAGNPHREMHAPRSGRE